MDSYGKDSIIQKATDWLAKKGVRNKVELYLSDAKAAQELQTVLLGTPFKYVHGVKNCVSHVKDILKAGGVDVSSLPNTVEEFFEALKGLE